MALGRRMTEGGSWSVTVSLQRTRDLLVSLGIDHDRTAGIVAPEQDEIVDLLDRRTTPFGIVTHVRPPGEIGGRLPVWDRPSTPAGTHPPSW